MSANRSSAIKHANIKNALFILIVAGLCFFLGCASPHGLILPSPWTFVAFSGNVKSFKSDDAAIVILNDTQPFFPRELVSADSLKKDIVLRSIYINGINSKVGSFRGDYLSGQRYHAFMLPSGEYSFSITTDYDVPGRLHFESRRSRQRTSHFILRASFQSNPQDRFITKNDL